MNEAVLLLATDLRVFVLDFSKLEKLGKVDWRDPPVALGTAVKVFNFVEEGFPFAARFFCHGSKLYMIGGEITRPGLSEDDLRTRSRTNLVESVGNGGLSAKIFVSDLTPQERIFDFREHLTMLGPKCSPIIQNIQGKFYILSDPPNNYKDPMPEPAFEVYDPESNQIEALANPPFHNIINHFVVGNSFYVAADAARTYRYSILNRKWDFLPNWSEEIPVPYTILPTGIGAAFVPAYEDILIAFSRHTLCAWKLLPDGATPNPLPQILATFFIYPTDDSDSVWGVRAVVATGQQNMCMVRPKMIKVGNEIRRLIYVGIFHVEKLLTETESSVPFVKATHISVGIYSLDEWGAAMPFLRSIFFYRPTGTDDGRRSVSA